MSTAIGMFILGAVLAVMLLASFGALNTPEERCTKYCVTKRVGVAEYDVAEHDGGELTYGRHGYACACGNLQPVKPVHP